MQIGEKQAALILSTILEVLGTDRGTRDQILLLRDVNNVFPDIHATNYLTRVPTRYVRFDEHGWEEEDDEPNDSEWSCIEIAERGFHSYY